MRADVCMITEGSYPYVVGGVSTWVHDLLTSLKDVSFSLVHIGVTKEIAGPIKYDLPRNVLDYRETFLMEPVPYRGPGLSRKRKSWEELESFIHEVAEGDMSRLESLLTRFAEGSPDSLTPYDIFHSQQFWEILMRTYDKHFNGFSFIDFFWTIRFMAVPLFRVIYAEQPEASLYHATCTGYAGLYGALANIRTRAPMIITEHGIYTNERMIEVTQAQWIYREKPATAIPSRQLGVLQSLWMGKFDVLSRIAYDHAARIFTLYEGNRLMQVQGGADPKKTAIIPNGINIARFDAIREKRVAEGREGPPQVAMVGRVAPIKDIKTFVRAAKIVNEAMPDVQFMIIGPTEEDESYYEECDRLVRVLSLKNVLKFTGAVSMDEHYPGLECVVLTSISEAQPFVILEAMRVGVPVIASNVGACAEMLLGVDEADQALGPSGIITNIRSPAETAHAIMAILKDPERAARMGEAGRIRAERYYDRGAMLSAYHDVYRQFCGGRWNI